MNSYTQINQIVDSIRATGKSPKVTKLPSQVTRNRKSLYTPKTRGKGSVKVGW